MKKRSLEQFDNNLFAKLDLSDILCSVGGATFRPTYTPTHVNGHTDTVLSDGLDD
jgi:hypothetical protein